jgi:trans-aconitate methyltransferase
LLDVGCGEYPSAETLRDRLPEWALYGIDLDRDALRRARTHFPDLRLVQADARHLPALLHTTFGLILVRHPDLFRRRAAWSRIIPTLPDLIAPGGALLITLYAPEEVELIRALRLPPVYALNGLASADFAGHDRYVLAFSR